MGWLEDKYYLFLAYMEIFCERFLDPIKIFLGRQLSNLKCRHEDRGMAMDPINPDYFDKVIMPYVQYGLNSLVYGCILDNAQQNAIKQRHELYWWGYYSYLFKRIYQETPGNFFDKIKNCLS